MPQAVNPFTARDDNTVDLLASNMVTGFSALIDQLVAYREKRKMSQADVAELVGLSEIEVDRFESRDGSPTVDATIAYALAVRCNVDISATDGEKWARERRARLSDRSAPIVDAWLSDESDNHHASPWQHLVVGSPRTNVG